LPDGFWKAIRALYDIFREKHLKLLDIMDAAALESKGVGDMHLDGTVSADQYFCEWIVDPITRRSFVRALYSAKDTSNEGSIPVCLLGVADCPREPN
jgi:hypothetical protein